MLNQNKKKYVYAYRRWKSAFQTFLQIYCLGFNLNWLIFLRVIRKNRRMFFRNNVYVSYKFCRENDKVFELDDSVCFLMLCYWLVYTACDLGVNNTANQHVVSRGTWRVLFPSFSRIFHVHLLFYLFFSFLFLFRSFSVQGDNLELALTWRIYKTTISVCLLLLVK